MSSDDIVIPEEVRQRYIERRQKDIESLRQALSSRSLDEFARIGHQLKGNAASFGYTDLEKIAVQLEQAGIKRDAHEASRQLEVFEEWYSKIRS